MSEREEYLDELLKEVDSASGDKKEQTSEEGILDNYDKELEGIDEDDFLQEFEKSLGEDLDTEIEAEFSNSSESDSELERELGLANDGTSADFMDNIDSIVNNVKSATLDDELSEGDLSIEESLKNFEEEDPDLDEIGREFVADTLEESFPREETEESDLFSGEEELSEAEKLAREIESLNLGMEEEKPVEKKSEESVEAEASKESVEPKKKKSFFARLSAALFGEEEGDIQRQMAAGVPADIENLSEDNLNELLELEKQNNVAAEAEEEKKKQQAEEKKVAKEQKAKEKEEKKAEKKALKEQKAKEKAEKKALMLQKQEPVVKSKPLPKKPVVLIVLFGLSIVILVNLLSGLIGYNTALSDAEDCYAQGEYVEAYGYLNEKDMKKSDLEFYNKVRLTSYLQQQLNSYDTYQGQKMYREALAALISSVGRYDRFNEEAAQSGVDKEYEKMLQKIEEALSSNYQMSLDEARTIYALDDKKELTYAVYDVIDKLGLAEEQ